MSLGSRVRKRREALGLAPIEAAVRAGFSEIYWRQIEGGQRRPQKHTSLQRIAHALDWTISDLTDGRGAQAPGAHDAPGAPTPPQTGLEGLYTTDGEAMIMARTTVTRAEVDAVWQAIADRGYDCSDLREVLAEYASDMLASVQTTEEAVRAAERAFGVAPGSSWCPECREGGVEADWNSERCELCGGWLEVT